jgi:hypothetical protein
MMPNLAEAKDDYNFKDLVAEIGDEEEIKYGSMSINANIELSKKNDRKIPFSTNERSYNEPNSPRVSDQLNKMQKLRK